MKEISTIASMDLAGGAPCLDFVNTMLNDDTIVERLHSYQDLLTLTRRLQLLDKGVVDRLAREAIKNPDQAHRIFDKARAARTSMLHVFQALASGGAKQIQPAELSSFNQYIHEALGKRQFTVFRNQLRTTWNYPPDALMQPVWLFILSACELLNTKNQSMIKQCGACAWLFLDETKNHRRKWCDMKTCGANQKARRFYQRKKMNKA